ncbi:MAG: alpha/beta hydrolase [Actinomycetota bacterium]
MKETHRLMPGAEPYERDGGPVGALVIHGFTGSPASTRPLANWLAEQGLSVSAPRLPGHGTHWEDLAQTQWTDWEAEAVGALKDLASRCEAVAVIGVSMGGALALHLAASHPDEVRCVAVINPYIHDPRLAMAPVVRLFARTKKLRTNDINKPGQDEVAYDRAPVVTLGSLGQLLKKAESELPDVRQPLLVFSSPQDHLVKPANSQLIMRKAGSTDKELVPLTNSFHVATLDHDADLIRARILQFARQHATP